MSSATQPPLSCAGPTKTRRRATTTPGPATTRLPHSPTPPAPRKHIRALPGYLQP
ncbi:hypothetical protein [Dermatophilus congolensis]|uniref:hypothetical protein n=1 Tax=Dermatophilus congolensis TaxID=1863 RepID=UPI0003FAF33B|nr:hypothetical protein [Dermatophilus congolensis]